MKVQEADGVKVNPPKSMLLGGFGATRPHQQPEDWRKVRTEMEEGIAEDALTRGQQEE